MIILLIYRRFLRECLMKKAMIFCIEAMLINNLEMKKEQFYGTKNINCIKFVMLQEEEEYYRLLLMSQWKE